MPFRPFHATAAALALVTGLGVAPAQAATQTSAPHIVSGSFTNLTIDTFALSGLTNAIVGSFEWGTGTINLSFGPATFTTSLASGTVGRTSLGDWVDPDPGAGYRFENIGPGSYELKVSGLVSGVGALRSISTVSSVSEPAGGTFLLAGIGALVLMQRRRRAAR